MLKSGLLCSAKKCYQVPLNFDSSWDLVKKMKQGFVLLPEWQRVNYRIRGLYRSHHHQDLCSHENKEDFSRLTERQEIGTFLHREFLPRGKSSYFLELVSTENYKLFYVASWSWHGKSKQIESTRSDSAANIWSEMNDRHLHDDLCTEIRIARFSGNIMVVIKGAMSSIWVIGISGPSSREGRGGVNTEHDPL